MRGMMRGHRVQWFLQIFRNFESRICVYMNSKEIKCPSESKWVDALATGGGDRTACSAKDG